eukprot:Clim_evm92s225 gene=Clim_evmTU92s225
MTVKKTLVAFDYDHTMVKDNTDTFVIKDLTPGFWSQDFRKEAEKMRNAGQGWTEMMDMAMLHMQQRHGISKEDFAKSLGRVGFDKEMIEALQVIQSAPNRDTEIHIVSDANDFYIEQSARAHGFWHFIHAIHTNPTYDRDGLMRVKPYQPYDKPHGCDRCNANMCKGLIMQDKLQFEDYDHTIYIGDGRNDLCPILRLRSSDHAFVREGFALERILKGTTGNAENDADPPKPQAQVHYWANERKLRELFEWVMLE